MDRIFASIGPAGKPVQLARGTGVLILPSSSAPLCRPCTANRYGYTIPVGFARTDSGTSHLPFATPTNSRHLVLRYQAQTFLLLRAHCFGSLPHRVFQIPSHPREAYDE